MSELAITALLVASLFLILASGVWIGLALSGVAWIAMQLFSARPAGDAMAVRSGARPPAGPSPHCRCSSGWGRSSSAPG